MEVFDIGGEVVIEMKDVSTKDNNYFSFDMTDSRSKNTVQSYMTKDKLRQLALFILNNLENEL